MVKKRVFITTLIILGVVGTALLIINTSRDDRVKAIAEIDEDNSKSDSNMVKEENTSNQEKLEATNDESTKKTNEEKLLLAKDKAKTYITERTEQVEKETESSKLLSKKLDVPIINQMDAPRLYNGCEVTSLAMILNYYDIQVTKNDLANNLKSVPLTYDNGLKGNPHDGFVGDVTGAKPGLGVYHEPIVSLASKYMDKTKIKDISGQDFDHVIKAVSEDKPVWVITTSTFSPVNNIQTWNTPSGKVDITFSVHSVVITGYDENNIYINNPYGQKNQKIPKNSFIKSWQQMGKQAIYFTK